MDKEKQQSPEVFYMDEEAIQAMLAAEKERDEAIEAEADFEREKRKFVRDE